MIKRQRRQQWGCLFCVELYNTFGVYSEISIVHLTVATTNKMDYNIIACIIVILKQAQGGLIGMKDSLRNKCDLFTDNYKEMNKKFKWNYTTNTKLGALLYAMEDKTPDIIAINNCKDMIKENTGIFSQFKDITFFMTSVMLSLHEEPETILAGAIGIYDDMKKEGFHSSSYLVLAALSIALQKEPFEYQRIILSAKNYYDAMKEEHRFITSSDDYGFAAMLAMTDKPVNQAVIEIENCYEILKEDFSYSNAVQSLSHVLIFSEEDAKVKCSRVVELYQALKNKKCKFGSGMELSFLGVISLLNEDIEKLAGEIAEAHEYLKDKKGFGYWSISAKERIMYAAALVCDDYLTDVKKNTLELTLANNIAGILLAQQMAMMVAASSGAAAAAASAT